MDDLIWKMVCSYMHYNGDKYGTLNDSQMWEVYCLADGFGKMSSEQLIEINDGWDWSHIRDSSREAINNMALRILEMTSNPASIEYARQELKRLS